MRIKTKDLWEPVQYLDQLSETLFSHSAASANSLALGVSKQITNMKTSKGLLLQFMDDNCSCGHMLVESDYKAHQFSALTWGANET